jgi:hypothetical protein
VSPILGHASVNSSHGALELALHLIAQQTAATKHYELRLQASPGLFTTFVMNHSAAQTHPPVFDRAGH